MKINLFISIFIFAVLLFGSFFYFEWVLDKKIEKKLESLDPQEREYLGNFFQYVIRASCFGYILYGDKPMGIDFVDYRLPSKSVDGFDYMDDHHIAYKYRFKEGWEVWKKYKHLFPSKNFLFFECPNEIEKEYMEIYLINKFEFTKIVNKNLNDFRSVLGENFSAEEILNNYINQEYYFKKISEHDGLLGILLGYGRNNSWAFMEQADNENRELVSFVSSICKENHEEVYMNLPSFAALPNDKETDELAIKYKEQRIEIEKIYKSKNFLLPTLKKIICH